MTYSSKCGAHKGKATKELIVLLLVRMSCPQGSFTSLIDLDIVGSVLPEEVLYTT